MATLSAHGREIGRIRYTTCNKAYMADGSVLRNDGRGWKLYAKCRPGFTPEQAYAMALQKQEELYRANPALKEYRQYLHRLAGISQAWKLHASVQLLGDDIDGIWSECCDGWGDNIHADVGDIAELVRLYKAATNKREA